MQIESVSLVTLPWGQDGLGTCGFSGLGFKSCDTM